MLMESVSFTQAIVWTLIVAAQLHLQSRCDDTTTIMPAPWAPWSGYGAIAALALALLLLALDPEHRIGLYIGLSAFAVITAIERLRVSNHRLFRKEGH